MLLLIRPKKKKARMNNEMVGEKIPELKEIVFLQDSDFSKTMQEMEKFMKSFGQNIKESDPYEELQNYDDNLMKVLFISIIFSINYHFPFFLS